MLMNNKTELYIHIGAHKTATTHFQDTLFKMQDKLSDNKINYLPRKAYRGKISRVSEKRFRLFDRLAFGMITKLYFDFIFKNNLATYDKILISDENILGNTVSQLSTKPYRYRRNLYKKLYFIKKLSKCYNIKLLLSIRSFDGIYSGAYATALRFHPYEAILAKASLLLELKSGELPFWSDLILDIKNILPNVDFIIWRQEDYKHYSSEIIKNVLGREINKVIEIPPPIETVTPSNEAIIEVENIIKTKKIVQENWLLTCDNIYKKHALLDKNDKFSLLEGSMKKKVQNTYIGDLAKIDYLFPGDMIKF